MRTRRVGRTRTLCGIGLIVVVVVVGSSAIAACGTTDEASRETLPPMQTTTSSTTSTSTISQDRFYTIQRGDTLAVIAAKFEVTMQSIIDLNKIENPDAIAAGQVIEIPANVRN